MRLFSSLSLIFLSATLFSPLAAGAKGGPATLPQAASAAAQQNEREAMQRAQQAQQQQRAQQEAMAQIQAKQQQQRAQQEQMMRAQEEQARKTQMQAMQQQQEQARKMQEKQQQVQQEQARKMQEQQQVQQEQARKMQEQQQEQARNVQKENFARAESTVQRPRENSSFDGKSAKAEGGRPFKARALSVSAVPIEKAVPQPVLAPGANSGEQEHAKAVSANLQRHLLAVPGAQAPQNMSPLVNNWRNNYFNNYSTVVNNRRISVNRQNTNVSYFQPYQYPTWYQPHPNWVLSNGFTLGNDIHCGLDWLQWGWHPYYGPPPEGFVCAEDYFPTPWIFIPAYGVWRQPGEFGYSSAGPPYDYTGPISVEVLEPRHVHTRDPYSGWVNDSVINIVYFYDAFYYPDADRWGYMNRHGYFIWLNLDQDD